MNKINKIVFNKEVEITFNRNSDMIDILIKINLYSQVTNYKKIK